MWKKYRVPNLEETGREIVDCNYLSYGRDQKYFCELGAEPSSTLIYKEFLEQQIDYQIVCYVKLAYLPSAGMH